MVLIPIALSGFTHLWNPTGFPDLFYDEGVYMRRAMVVLENQNLQENLYYYDHPLFGQIFLAGLLGITGYPDSLTPSPTAESIEALYAVPKIWMGLLAMADTFLIHRIAKHKYGDSRVAFLAATLFAVMPIGWLFRRIVLESLLMPFLLTSILFALRSGSSEGNRQKPFILLSGICLGVAIFTKIPAFTMIPLVGLMVYTGNRSGKDRLGNTALWFLPVILIPALWPAYSIFTNSFDYWVSGVFNQTQRMSDGIIAAAQGFLIVDPLLLSLGIVGIGFAILKRDLFILIWIGPFMLFLTLIGYVQYFHIMPVIPAFCISAALWLSNGIDRIRSKVLVKYWIPAAVAIFGFVSTALLITTDVTSSQFEATAFVLSIADNETTIAANPVYAWPYDFVFNIPYAFNDYRDLIYYQVPTQKLVIVSDLHYRGVLPDEERLRQAYDDTVTVKVFYSDAKKYEPSMYPYSSMLLNYQGDAVEVRSKPT